MITQTDIANVKAGIDFIELHIGRLKKAVANGNYAEACQACFALDTETKHVCQMASKLSLDTHLQQQRSNAK